MENKRISVIGNGRLGLSFSLLCNSVGYEVNAYEQNKERTEQIKNKTLKTTEPEVEQLLANHTLNVTDTLFEAVKASDLIFILVATPSLVTGEYDHSQIESVFEEIKKFDNIYTFGKTFVVGATVMPGYCKELQERCPTINIVYQPFFIAQGSILKDIAYADIVLIGGKPTDELLDVYDSLMVEEPKFRIMSTTAAEISKISLNCFLTTKISFANKIGEICINSGVENEVDYILETIGNDSRVGNKFLRYGFGYSGVCLPRDNRALGLHARRVDAVSKLQTTIDEINNEHVTYLFDYYWRQNKDKSKPFTFYQLSYKRGVDILTDSQPLNLCIMFLNHGFKVNIVESESIIEQVFSFLQKYGEQVSYNGNEKGIEINLQ